MSVVTASTADSYTNKSSSSSWDAAQGDASSSAGLYNNSRTTFDFGIYNLYSGGRGGNTYYCVRSWIPFDLSGESGTVASATLSIYADNLGSSGNSAKIIGVLAGSLDGSIADHGNCYSSGTTFFDDLTDVITISTTAGFHTFTLNNDGIIRVNANIGSGTLTFGILGYHYDYSENVPSLGGDYSQIRIDYADGSNDPYLTLTYVSADNAVFFGSNF